MDVCTDLELSTSQQKGLEICSCGWTLSDHDGLRASYPMTQVFPECGNAIGIIPCTNRTRANVFCCGVKQLNPTCEKCAEGSFSAYPNENLFCHSCPSGKFQAATGASICDECYRGQYAPMDRATECFYCPAGKYQHQDGQSGCVSCAAGTFNAVAGSSIGASDCTACPIGKWSAAGKGECKACSPGTFSETEGAHHEGLCEKCPAGKFGTDSSAETCKECPAGKYTHVAGQQVCDQCAAGKYLTDAGQQIPDVCLTCPAGKYSNDGQSECTDCAPGRATEIAGAPIAHACHVCPQGQFASAPGTAVCTYCPPGKFDAVNGTDMLRTHEHGALYLPHARQFCETCPGGKHQTQYGAILNDDGSAPCTECDAGKYSVVAGPCTDCQEGSFQPSSGLDHCMQCPSGSYNEQRASTESADCKSCPVGTYAIQTGMAACTHCPAGRVSTVVAAVALSACEHCPAGKYQEAAGKSTCTLCQGGKYGQVNQLGAVVSDHCLHCPMGKYQEADGAIACVECAANTYLNAAGSSSESDCVACETLDDNRYFWTDGLAGQHQCVERAFHCPLSNWSVWGDCSHTCGVGIQAASRSPVATTSCADSIDDCAAAWGGGRACDTYAMQKHQVCNIEPCAIDCQVSEWSEWSQCSASCGAGTTTRTRKVTIYPAFGGKACQHLDEMRDCNTHECTLGLCHSKHIHCSVVTSHIHEGTPHMDHCHISPNTNKIEGCSNLCSLYDHPATEPNEMWDRIVNSHDLNLAFKGKCHDTEGEWLKNMTEPVSRLIVAHDRAFMHRHSNFLCKKTTPGQCACYCDKHPPCCQLKGVTTLNAEVFANTFQNIETTQECCDLTTNHPTATHYSFDRATGVCTLKTGEITKYVRAHSETMVTGYSSTNGKCGHCTGNTYPFVHHLTGATTCEAAEHQFKCAAGEQLVRNKVSNSEYCKATANMDQIYEELATSAV